MLKDILGRCFNSADIVIGICGRTSIYMTYLLSCVQISFKRVLRSIFTEDIFVLVSWPEEEHDVSVFPMCTIPSKEP